jgi:tetratricopeptide (TPR) repeat protein
MNQTSCGVSKYLQFYKENWYELMDSGKDALAHDYSNGSILTTWIISYKDVVRKSEHAGNLLRLWAFLDNRDIWYGLFAQLASKRKFSGLQHILTELQEAVSTELKFHNVMSILLAYSLIGSTENLHNQPSYSMHPVVHEWIYNWTLHSLEERKCLGDLTRFALMLLAFSIPPDTQKEYWILQQRVLTHATRCYGWVERGLIEGATDFGHSFALQQIGYLFAHQEKPKEAENIYRRALAMRGNSLGWGDELTLLTAQSLGNLYLEQDRLYEAENMYRWAHEGQEKALGPQNMSTLNTLHCLGNLYLKQGKLDQAEYMYRRVLQGSENTLGPGHTSTLNTIDGLGNLYLAQNRLGEAEINLHRALKGRETALGPEHKLTLHTIHTLGVLYFKQSNLNKAEEMLQQALAGRKKVLGRSHKLTLETAEQLRKVEDRLRSVFEMNRIINLD